MVAKAFPCVVSVFMAVARGGPVPPLATPKRGCTGGAHFLRQERRKWKNEKIKK